MATKPPRLFVPLDVNYADDDKVLELSIQAELLWVRMLCEAKKRTANDGNLTQAVIKATLSRKLRGISKYVQELETVGLITPSTVDGRPAWHITSWSDWNMTETESDKRRQDRMRGGFTKAHREGRHKNNPVGECPSCAATSSGAAVQTQRSDHAKRSRREEKTKSSTSIPPYPPRGYAPGGPGDNTPHYDNDWDTYGFRPRDYLYDPTHEQHGGWATPGSWINPAQWREGWGPHGQRPHRTSPTIDELAEWTTTT